MRKKDWRIVRKREEEDEEEYAEKEELEEEKEEEEEEDDEMVTVHENIDNERGKKKITGQNHKKEGEKICEWA